MNNSADLLSVSLPTNQPADVTLISRSADLLANLKNRDESRICHILGEDARVQLVSCFEDAAVSVTIRGNDNSKSARQLELPFPWDYRLKSDYRPKSEPKDDALNTVHEICQAVYDVLRLDENREVHGFLIVSGTTNSLKTKLALGLIHFYLEARMREWLASKGKQRKPHLVTCEDDIERYFLRLEALQPIEDGESAQTAEAAAPIEWLENRYGPDYTPRRKSTDVDGGELGQAVDSALRMTPAVFYAGEIRNPKDWKSLYRLAQSHLVVLTTHASGLVNTFEILRQRLKAQSPAQHSELAASVFAVVHTRSGPPLEPKLPSGSKDVTGSARVQIKSIIPTCWLNTPMSVSSFTSDGLASLVGKYTDLSWRYSKPKGKRVDLPYAVGRRAFAEVLLKLAKCESEFNGFGAPYGPGRQQPVSLSAPTQDRFIREATAWDLRGE